MLYREITAVCSEIHTKHITTLCGQNVQSVNVTPGGTYSNHWAWDGCALQKFIPSRKQNVAGKYRMLWIISGFVFLMDMAMTIVVMWDVTPCSLVCMWRRFGAACSLHLHSRTWRQQTHAVPPCRNKLCLNYPMTFLLCPLLPFALSVSVCLTFFGLEKVNTTWGRPAEGLAFHVCQSCKERLHLSRFHTHLHLTCDSVWSAKFDQISVCSKGVTEITDTDFTSCGSFSHLPRCLDSAVGACVTSLLYLQNTVLHFSGSQMNAARSLESWSQ
jgi:hypothetical protein